MRFLVGPTVPSGLVTNASRVILVPLHQGVSVMFVQDMAGGRFVGLVDVVWLGFMLRPVQVGAVLSTCKERVKGSPLAPVSSTALTAIL